MTLDDYDELLASQHGVCALCGKSSERPLVVDHCHQTERVRGLLCAACNSGLGHLGDDPELLEKGIAYLTRESK